MPNLGGNAPYYGGGQVPNPANVTQIYETVPTFQASLGSVAVNATDETAFMAVAESGSGNRTVWAPFANSAGNVTEVTGTQHQVTASPTTGHVVVGLTNGVSLGSYSAVNPPTGGLLLPGQVAIGTSAPIPNSSLEIFATSSNAYQLNLSGTLSGLDGSQNQFGITLDSNLQPSATCNQIAGLEIVPTFTTGTGHTTSQAFGIISNVGINANLGTITDAANIFTGAGSVTGNIATNAYGGYFTGPVFGTNRAAVFADDLSIGIVPSGSPTAGTLRSAPPTSNTATVALGTITFGTPIQNTLGYDIMVSGTIDVSSATGGVIGMGIGRGPSPTTNPLTQALTTVTDLYIGFSAYVPSSYFFSLAGTGTIVVGSVVSVVTPV